MKANKLKRIKAPDQEAGRSEAVFTFLVPAINASASDQQLPDYKQHIAVPCISASWMLPAQIDTEIQITTPLVIHQA